MSGEIILKRCMLYTHQGLVMEVRYPTVISHIFSWLEGQSNACLFTTVKNPDWEIFENCNDNFGTLFFVFCFLFLKKYKDVFLF